ncbi:MAG TPA: hypothetical protein VII49_08435 [Rhizomicrobium sp.]
MGGKAWRWFGWAVVALTMVVDIIRALRSPWTWTAYQCLFLLVVVSAVTIATMVGYVWIRHGREGLNVRWRLFREASAKTPPRRVTVLNLLFWIAVAIALVVYFQVTHR